MSHVIPVTVADRPDAIHHGSSLGDVAWSEYCAFERRRINAHGKQAVVQTDRFGLILVGIVIPPRKGAPRA